MKYDLETVKAAATGQWEHLLSTICGIAPEILDGRGHPCPNPSCPSGPGRDRFSARDIQKGSLFCRHCNNSGTNTMDGIGAVQWLTGFTFPESVDAVGDALGLPTEDRTVGPKRPLIELVAAGKGVRPQDLLMYGASTAIRRDEGADHPVIRFPMYNEIVDGQLVPGASFDLGIATKMLRKGKSALGRTPGLFLPRKERDGRIVVWAPAAGQKVFLVEGVKDAAKLMELGYPAVGLPSTGIPKDLAAVFRGMLVYLVPDRDRAGVRGANQNGALLWGIAKEIRIVHLPSPVKPSDGDGVREIARKVDGPKLVAAAIATSEKWTADGIGAVEHVTMYDAAIACLEKMEGGDVPLMSTGIYPLDSALFGGMAQGEIIVVGARPSHCKSVVGLQMTVHQAMHGGTSLFCSEEMEPTLLAKRWLSSISEKSLKQTDPRELIDLVRTDYADMQRILISPKLYQVDKVVHAMEIAAQQYGTTLCVIDYVQLLRDSGNRSRYDQVTEISVKLTQAAKRTGMTTVILAQLNREPEKRGYPITADLRESGQLEQDADVVLLLWYPYMVKGTTSEQGDFEIHVAKNRNRGLPKDTTIRLDFDGSRMTFTDPAYRRALEAADDLFREMP